MFFLNVMTLLERRQAIFYGRSCDLGGDVFGDGVWG